MNMKFSVLQRLILLDLFPTEGDFRTLRIIRDLKYNLAFSEEDLKAIKFEHLPDGRMKWTGKLDDKDIPIGEITQEVIKERLIFLEKEKKLTIDSLSLYEKFVLKQGENR